MIKEDLESEKRITIIESIACAIIYFVISLIIVFTIGLSKVDAATQYRYRNSSNTFSSWENATQDTTYNFTQNTSTTYVVGVQFQDTTKFSGTNKYDYFISGTYTLRGFTGTIYNFNVQTYIYNGTNLTNVSSLCTYNGTQSNINDGGTVKKTLAFSINCTGLTGANYYPYMTIQIKSDSGANSRSELYISRFSLIQTSANLDSSSIINNNNNNTQSIINNNNQNTETIVNGQKETTDAVNDLNDTLKDDNVDNPSNSLNNMETYFGNNGVISDLLLLPVRMYQSIINTIDGTCSPFNLGTLFEHNLTMPCINIQDRLGSSLYNVIDVLISGFFILAIRKKFVDIFEHFTSLKTGGNELE